MQPRPLQKSPTYWNHDIMSFALVAIYIFLTFLLMLTWDRLSDKADAFSNEAKRIDREKFADTVLFQIAASKETNERARADAKSVGVTSDGGTPFKGSLACGSLTAEICEQLRTISPR